VPIRSARSRKIGTAVEHDTAMPITAVGASVGVLAFGYTTEALLPEGTVYWGGEEDGPHDFIGSGIEVLLLLIVVLCAGRLLTQFVGLRGSLRDGS